MILLSKYTHTLLYVSAFLLVIFLIAAINYYRTKHIVVKKQVIEQQELINDMRRRQKNIAELNARYVKEQEDAQNYIQALRRDVATGRRRLQLHATCDSSASPATGSVGDAARARPDNAAEWDYFTLRERIDTVTRQVNYLQQYVKTQCLR